MIIEHGQYLHLQGKNVSYILRIHEKGYLLHHYFGRKLRTNDYITLAAPHRSFYAYNSDEVFLEEEKQEYQAGIRRREIRLQLQNIAKGKD